ncbi:hypothetical protein A0256_23120 [Mucilaginibacter sp. PAMC 26640]|nr:hypothetical protein A0256_23120 [Mucilaginibacter sp. PAMC 26640]
MQDNQLFKSVADTFTDKPIYEINVPIRNLPAPKPRSIWDRLLRRPVAAEPETHRILTFYPCVVANQYRIAGECALLPTEIYEDQSMNIALVLAHQPRIVYIVASAIQNNHLEPDSALIQFIECNMTGEQLQNCLMASFQALNMEAFTNTIILMRPMVNILMSPEDGSESIASHIEA